MVWYGMMGHGMVGVGVWLGIVGEMVCHVMVGVWYGMA